MRTITVILLAALLALPALAVDFKLPLVGGGTAELSALRAQSPVVVCFWATWCHPCQDELVYVQRLYAVYADSGIGFVGVSIDDAKSSAKIKSLLKGRKYTFPVALDAEQQAYAAFGLSDVPATFIIGQDGATLYSHFGYRPGDETLLEDAVRRALHPQVPDPTRGDSTKSGH
ncbi:MAG TPA: TlpA disulfide reductase family protein [Candidatus Edwardsbacteria bacterium]|nr:TlpA disulfide reductase family protein [Candidatus Edwardsbacteria bacterium]